MADTSLLWLAVSIATGTACLVVAVQRYRTGDPVITPLAGIALVIGWRTERAAPTGSLPSWLLESVTVAALLVVFGVLGVRALRRWRAWADEGRDTSL